MGGLLAGRGGCWIERGVARIHLGVEAGCDPAKKAHPALLVDEPARLVSRREEAGVAMVERELLAGFDRRCVDDSRGNRIEIVQSIS